MANLYGVEVPDIEQNFMAVDAMIIVKGIYTADDGHTSIRYREITTSGLSPAEKLGMATTMADTWRLALMNMRKPAGE